MRISLDQYRNECIEKKVFHVIEDNIKGVCSETIGLKLQE